MATSGDRNLAIDTSNRDFRTVLVEDAVSMTSDERLADLDRIGVNRLSTESVIAAVRR